MNRQKVKYPEQFYVFTSFDVSEYYRHSKEVDKYMTRFVVFPSETGGCLWYNQAKRGCCKIKQQPLI